MRFKFLKQTTVAFTFALGMMAGSFAINANAEPPGFNYDESKVPQFTLPDPLVMEDGTKVTDAQMWREKRRPEILKLFQTEMFGKSPAAPKELTFEVVSVEKGALNGIAVRKLVSVWFNKEKTGPKVDLLIYLPMKSDGKPVPIVFGYNFTGNMSIQNDPAVPLTKSWMRNSKKYHVYNNKVTEKTRGTKISRWNVPMILKRGYGLATVYYGDVDPDFDDGFKNGVHALYPEEKKIVNGVLSPVGDNWSSIAAWSWGASRMMDYFEKDCDIDHQKVALLGHSRLGKTSLWAGASDERFAIVISNDSGCGGAALSRRHFGETVQRINTSFQNWFCRNFKKYNEKENTLPIDQHQLIALIAPRPVYVASAEDDKWADPKGEFLSARFASPVYELLGKQKIATETMPKVNSPITGDIGYHMRSGKHDVTDYDWQQFLNFADKHFKK